MISVVFLAGDDDVLKLTWLQATLPWLQGLPWPKRGEAALEVDPECGLAGGTGLEPRRTQSQCGFC